MRLLPRLVLAAPAFWRHDGLPARLLAPIGAIWGAITAARMRARPRGRVDVPVVVVGNFTQGGAGKTPVVAALIAAARAAGRRPAVVTRGYGGSTTGPLRVDPARHSSHVVGDEALLHAALAPTVVAADRVAGARLAEADGADLILLDDGLQNPALARDGAIVVIDGGAGIGNGRVVPAGPLRAPLDVQLATIDAAVVIDGGDGIAAATAALAARIAAAGHPVATARVTVREAATFAGGRFLAFAGIGRPEKFAATLRAIGAAEVRLEAFGDHQHLDEAAARRLLDGAEQAGLTLVTTAKDAARLAGETSPALARLRAAARVVAIDLAFDGDGLWPIVAARIAGGR